MWFVRAGKGAAHASEFRNQGFVALGWKEAGPLSPDVTDEELDQALAAAYPDNKENSRNVYAAQIRRYTREVRVGDHVVTYDNADRAYLIGTIESDVVWEDEDLPRRRRVNWTLRVDRDSLSEDARNKLGSIATFFKVGPEARGELVQNAQPLFGDASPAGPVVGQRARGLVFEDFDVLRRNPVSASWPTLPDADRVSIKQLRQALLSYAVKLSDELQSAVPLKPFASHPNPSGRNAQHYWS